MNVKQIVTNKILEQMEKGVCPWHRPWTAIGKGNISGHTYSGVNRWLLADTEDTLFMTYKQAKELGGNVRKGEKAHLVVFWKMFQKEEGGAVKEFPLLRYYNVFGLSQVENIDSEKLRKKEFSPAEHAGIEDVECFVSSTGVIIEHTDKARAFYSPREDKINMPDLGQFRKQEDYYRTLFHELTHWTGAKERCNREIKNSFGSSQYAREELCAEVGSALLSFECGFENIEQSAAYIDSWKQAIRDDNNIIFWAATRAEQAVNFLKTLAMQNLAAA